MTTEQKRDARLAVIVTVVVFALGYSTCNLINNINGFLLKRTVQELEKQFSKEAPSEKPTVPITFYEPKANDSLYVKNSDFYILPPTSVQFSDVGKLTWETGELKFEGNVHKSAKIFFEYFWKSYCGCGNKGNFKNGRMQ